jgi:hypothetical protein
MERMDFSKKILPKRKNLSPFKKEFPKNFPKQNL